MNFRSFVNSAVGKRKIRFIGILDTRAVLVYYVERKPRSLSTIYSWLFPIYKLIINSFRGTAADKSNLSFFFFSKISCLNDYLKYPVEYDCCDLGEFSRFFAIITF